MPGGATRTAAPYPGRPPIEGQQPGQHPQLPPPLRLPHQPQQVTNKSQEPERTKNCIVNAHGIYNNLPTIHPNRKGAYGVPETQGTAAIDRSQFLPPGSSMTGQQANAYVNKYRSQISGYVPNGNGGYTQVFKGVSDNMGPASGVGTLTNRYPGRVLIELPGGRNLGNVNGALIKVPSAMPCPHSS